MQPNNVSLKTIPPKSQKLTDIIERALMEPTLLKAMVWLSVWDTDRAVQQAIRNHARSGGTSYQYETFTNYLFEQVSSAWDRRKQEQFTLQLVRGLRANYFPERKKVGECIDVALLLSEAMKQNYMSVIHLIHGKIGDCLHTWIRVNGVDIDPAVDCTTVESKDLVRLATGDEYVVIKVEPFDLKNYYKDLTFQQLCDALLPTLRTGGALP